MEIKIVRYYDNKYYYAKVRVSESNDFIAIEVDSNSVTNNDYNVYINIDIYSLLKCGYKEEYTLRIDNDLGISLKNDAILTNEIVLMSKSVTKLEKFINMLVEQIKKNYHSYQSDKKFEKECLSKWNKKEVEIIYDKEYVMDLKKHENLKGIQEIISNLSDIQLKKLPKLTAEIAKLRDKFIEEAKSNLIIEEKDDKTIIKSNNKTQ